MKLKAVLNISAPAAMVNAVHSSAFRSRVLQSVLVSHLHMRGDVGPAEFYIQESDRVVGDDRQLCEARLTGVSVNDNRAPGDFYRARAALERLYAQTVHQHLADGQQLQLMICLMLDKAPKEGSSPLIERSGRNPAVTIVGGTPLAPDLLREIDQL